MELPTQGTARRPFLALTGLVAVFAISKARFGFRVPAARTGEA